MSIIGGETKEQVIIENEIQTLFIENGIVIKIYNKAVKNITLKIAKQLVSERIKLCNGKTYPMLADTNGLSRIDNDAREYLGSEEACKFVSAIAILSYGTISKIIINFYIKFAKAKVPMKMFSSREKAIIWLKRYKNLN